MLSNLGSKFIIKKYQTCDNNAMSHTIKLCDIKSNKDIQPIYMQSISNTLYFTIID